MKDFFLGLIVLGYTVLYGKMGMLSVPEESCEHHDQNPKELSIALAKLGSESECHSSRLVFTGLLCPG